MESTALDAREASSPFAPAGVTSEPVIDVGEGGYRPAALSSPFSEAFASDSEADRERRTLQAMLAELQDEDFDAALEAVADDAAARHLRSAAAWTPAREAPELPRGEVEQWLAQSARELDTTLGELERRWADRTPDSLADHEVEAAVHELAASHNLTGSMEQLFGGLIGKALSLGKGLVKQGLSTIGKLLPTGVIFAAVRRLVGPLLKWVLGKATTLLPEAVRPIATELARKLLGEAEATSPVSYREASSRFDSRLAEALLNPTEPGEHEDAGEGWQEADPVAALDAARSRLVRELTEAPPGEAPVAQLEQFIPAVMAALPLVRTGIGLIGRKRVVDFLTTRLADVIAGHIGRDKAQALAGPIVNAGMSALRLEAEAPAQLGAEAMVAAVEDAVREVLSLPEASLNEPLRLEAELQEAFADATARYLPREALREDLPGHESAGGSGVWVAMPRVTRPCYRYRKYSRVFRVPISRPQARIIVLRHGDTLEERLLDAGARSWPVTAEIHLYETLPGAVTGHLAAFEDEAEPQEFEALTPATAAALIGEPGLGRPSGLAGRQFPQQPRLFRLVTPGLRVRRQRPRFAVRLVMDGARPTLRVHLRLGERVAHLLAGQLDQQGHARAIALVRGVLGAAAQQSLARRLVGASQHGPQGALSPERATAVAAHVAEAILATLAKQLPAAAPSLRSAAQDPALGLTLTFAFPLTGNGLHDGMPGEPTMTIRPGFHRD